MCKFQALRNMDPPGGSLKCVLFSFLGLAGDSVAAGITIREWRGCYSSVTRLVVPLNQESEPFFSSHVLGMGVLNSHTTCC